MNTIKNSPYANCKICQNKLNELGWCGLCRKNTCLEQQFDNWTSGNNDIDEFIKSIQITTKYKYYIIEWIAFSEFTNIEKIGEGGFSSVYKAIWKEGYIYECNVDI